MKRTKEQIEKAKAESKPRKLHLGRPTRTEPTERLTVYMPEAVSQPMREKIKRTRDTVSNYLTRLAERDLTEAEK